MARIRTIKPDAWQDRRLGEVSRDARLLWVVLITQADDAGRFRAFPPTIWGHGYVHEPDAMALIPGWLGELERAGLIRLYEVNGEQYGDLPRWSVHQKISKPTPSRLPEFQGSPGFPVDSPGEGSLGFPGEPRVSRAGRDKEEEKEVEEEEEPRGRAVVVSTDALAVCKVMEGVGLPFGDPSVVERLIGEHPDVDVVAAAERCAEWAAGKSGVRHPVRALLPFLTAPDAPKRQIPQECLSRYDEGTIEAVIE